MEIQPPDDGYVLAETIGDKKKCGKLHWVKTNKEVTLIIDDQGIEFTCPYGQTGDRLWVRETWYECINNNDRIYYAASETPVNTISRKYKKRPSIFLRRNNSRINLEITNIKVERLHDITEDEAIKEGTQGPHHLSGEYSHGVGWFRSAISSFLNLWEKINGKGSWQLNPYVWVVSFKVL